jgi:rod shape-determining protein MreD
MKLSAVVLVVIAAAALQVTLARFTAGGRIVFDFVLVGVVFSALQWGPVAGILTGTLGGLLQDVLAGTIVGVGGLAKTLAGCAAGIVGTQFVLVSPYARMLIVAGATLLNRAIVLGLEGLIEQRWPGIVWTAMLAEVGINTLAGLLAFQAVNNLPALMNRQRAGRRSSLSRRNW